MSPKLENIVSEGKKIIYTGPMCASKSLQLVHHYKQLQALSQTIYAFVHAKNDSDTPCIVSRLNGETSKVSVPAISVNNSSELLSKVESELKRYSGVTSESHFKMGVRLIDSLRHQNKLVEVRGSLRWNPQFYVIIDELNFFDSGIKKAIERMSYWGVNVFAGGLEHDYRKELFTLEGGVTVSEIAGIADSHRKLTALCQYEVLPGIYCGEEAEYTMRFRDEAHTEPSHYGDELIIPNKKLYVPVCRMHHVVPGKFD